MKRIILLTGCLIFSYLFVGQTVLLHEKTSDYDFAVPKRGPNFRHFSHLYIGFAFFLPQNEDNEIETKLGSTTSFSVGWRYKLKITNWLATGVGLNYSNDVFNLVQNENKLVPNTTIHDKEKLRFNHLGPEFYIRLNFGKRGNMVGRFIDAGIYYNWTFRVKHMFQDHGDKVDTAYSAGRQRVINSDLDFVELFNYGFRGRIGFNRFVLTASYRMDELLKEEYTEELGGLFLPRFNVGLEIGLHK